MKEGVIKYHFVCFSEHAHSVSDRLVDAFVFAPRGSMFFCIPVSKAFEIKFVEADAKK